MGQSRFEKLHTEWPSLISWTSIIMKHALRLKGKIIAIAFRNKTPEE